MVKDRDGVQEGSFTLAPTVATHPLYTDHPLLCTYLSPSPLEEELLAQVSPNRELLAEHEAEFKSLLLQRLHDRSSEQRLSPTEEMRWAALQMKLVSQMLTVKYRKAPGRKYMFYPRRLQKLHDKIRGRIPLAKGETLDHLKKRVIRTTRIWTRRRLEKVQQQRDKNYDADMKKTYRRLFNSGCESTHVLEEEAAGGHYTQAAERDDCARRVIGQYWRGSNTTLAELRSNEAWMKYVRPDPADTLANVGAELTTDEIEQAYTKMSKGKATQSDTISKEMMDLVPIEYKQRFINYIKHAFQNGIDHPGE